MSARTDAIDALAAVRAAKKIIKKNEYLSDGIGDNAEHNFCCLLDWVMSGPFA